MARKTRNLPPPENTELTADEAGKQDGQSAAPTDSPTESAGINEQVEGVGNIVVAAHAEGFRRAGRSWSCAPTTVAISEFTEAQIEQLKAEPMLVVVEQGK